MSQNHVVIWGAGHIGYSAGCHLAAAGDAVAFVDTDPAKVAAIRARECPVKGLAGWLGGVNAAPEGLRAFDSGAEAARGVDAKIHHVAVPTERDGAPWDGALLDVARQIAEHFASPALVIIESTVAPSWLDDVQAYHPGLRLVAAPRRDWFDDPKLHLGAITRVVGADDPEVLALACAHLRRISPSIVEIPSLRLAALVKAVENDLRFVCIAWANSLATSLGHEVDVRQVLRIAATKWNIGLYNPGIGCGGPCLPLAGQYLAIERAQPDVSIAAHEAERDHLTALVDMLQRAGGSVAFLGLAYKAPAPFTPSCPAVWIAHDLAARGIRVGVFPDDDAQIKAARDLGAEMLSWPDDVGRHAALVVPVASARARDLTPAQAAAYSLVLDHEEALSAEAREACRRYVLVGARRWNAW